MLKPTQIQRNEQGFGYHPELPHFGEQASEATMSQWLYSRGFEHHFVNMKGELADKWGRGEINNCSDWQPETDVEGAFLGGIWDSTDGVVALFLSPIKTPKQVLMDAWVAEYAMLLIRRCHYELVPAIEMGKNALKNLNDDIDAITPSDAVDDEISSMHGA